MSEVTNLFESDVAGLPDLREATSVHHAVGLWWAHALMSCHFDKYPVARGNESTAARNQRHDNERQWSNYAQRFVPYIGEDIDLFAGVISRLAKETDQKLLAVVDHTPDDVLQAALNSPHLSGTYRKVALPACSYTYIFEDGSERALGKLGASGTPHIIWPPERRT